ncbi:MAG: LysR family transcriptional regulator [Acidaminobacter sp.]|uniref:LysR family transcriptional regulator n=1 Tax=Acidaminobacter sp. TaxID=1872102 RepID=UPI001381E66C|nr:LysR family transcriptional regulator [Acidaminobacter sp.]MZQ99184.1 LysR family transcriptional regulator [Acidaminobacter sp.]
MKNFNTSIFIQVLEVEKCGSISRAAQNLFLSQSNLSTSIKSLENELGYSIFTRSSQGVTITPEGKLFLKSAKIIYAELRNIEKIEKIYKAKDSNLSIVCVYSSFIFQKFIEFRKNYFLGNTKDSFKETGLNQAMQDIIAKTYRVGFFYDFDNNIHKRWELAEKYFLDINLLSTSIPVTALISVKHPLSNEAALTPETLQSYPIVTFEDFENDDWLGAMGILAEKDVLYIFDRGGMIETVKNGHYIGISVGRPISFIKEDMSLVSIPIHGIQHQLNQYWVKSNSYELNEVEQGFLRFIKKF